MGRMVSAEECMNQKKFNDICLMMNNGNSDGKKGNVSKFHAHVSEKAFAKIIMVVCEDQKNNPVQE